MTELSEQHADRAALDAALYTAFARYPPPKPMRTRWGTSLSLEEMRPLMSKPLDQLSWYEVGRYVYKAMSLWGNADDYCHFLPRLLELLVEDPPEPHTVVNEALTLYNVGDEWRTWPEVEREALPRYLDALWRYILFTFDPARPLAFLQDAPCCIAQVVDDLAPYLASWEEAGSTSSLAYLAHYVNANSGALVQGASLSNDVYWTGRRISPTLRSPSRTLQPRPRTYSTCCAAGQRRNIALISLSDYIANSVERQCIVISLAPLLATFEHDIPACDTTGCPATPASQRAYARASSQEMQTTG
jgi:hypothetical protein